MSIQISDLYDVLYPTFGQGFLDLLANCTVADINAFWKILIEYLSDTDRIDEHFHQNENVSSVMGFIQTKSDKDIVDVDDVANDYWNESIKNMAIFYNNHIKNPVQRENTWNTLLRSVVGNGRISMSSDPDNQPTPADEYPRRYNSYDIANADAGFKFGECKDSSNWTQLTRPWYNADDWATYYKVRTDYSDSQDNEVEPTMPKEKIDNRAATSDANMHFTRQQVNGENDQDNDIYRWIRLLMPCNSRRVAVEDLNRNFWVIGNTMAAICSYIFGPASPSQYLIKNSLKEIAELWENIMYLWAAVAVEKQGGTKGIKTIILPLNEQNSKYCTYEKYDNIHFYLPPQYDGVSGQSNYMRQQIQQVIDKYSKYHLCILVYTKNNNYYKNYFAQQIFRGVWLYNSITKKHSWFPTVYQGLQLKFAPEDFSTKLYAAREEEFGYKWCYPLSNIPYVRDDSNNPVRFYGALRIKPEIKVSTHIDVNGNNSIYVEEIKLIAYDAMAQVLEGKNIEICRYTLLEPFDENETYTDDQNVAHRIHANFSYSVNNFEPIYGNTDIYDCAIDRAYYLGEIPSCSKTAKHGADFEIYDTENIIGDGRLIKIGNYYPTNYVDNYSNKCGLQSNPEGDITDYAMNITAKLTTTNEINDAYGGSGSGLAKNSTQCKFLVPKVAKNLNNVDVYSYDTSSPYSGFTNAQMTAQNYQAVGYSVIKNYLENLGSRIPTAITYFIAGIGINPWHNSVRDTYTQGYWTRNILTHVYVYVPLKYFGYVSFTDASAVDIGQTSGKLYCLCPVNKIEAKFGGSNYFYAPITSWRLPQIIPNGNALNTLYFYRNKIDGEIYVSEYHYTIEQLNDHYEDYINNGTLAGKQGIKLQINSLQNAWCVFDGNSSAGKASNVHIYKRDVDRREVGYLTCVFNNGNSSFDISNKQARAIGDTGFDTYSGTDFLPAINTAPYSW